MLTTFSLVLFGASLTALIAAAFAWRRRKVPGGLALMLTLLSIAVWCFFSAMETTSLDAAHRYLWNAVSYIGVCNVAPFFLVFALQYSDSRWPLTAWALAVYWSVPLATIVLAFTNGWHHLIWTGFTKGPVVGTNTVVYSHGIWYFIAVAWFFGLCVLASFHLVRVALRAARLYVLQSLILLACVAIPWVGFLLFVLPNGPFPGLDTTSLGFTVSGILILAALNRLRFLDLVPKARATVVERLQDGFLVLDAMDRVIDINSTAVRLLGINLPAIGRKLADIFPALSDLMRRSPGAEALTLSSPHETAATLEVSVTWLTNRSGRQTGKVLLLRDITERRLAEKEREKLIAELRDALANLKRLSGLLPICASCKKIRDDQGYWHQVENYMQDHAEVEFSHGICPECAAKLYPELHDTPGTR